MLFLRSHVQALVSRNVLPRRSHQFATAGPRRSSSTSCHLLEDLARSHPQREIHALVRRETRLFSSSVDPSKGWTQLGLVTELVDAVSSFEEPTEVQDLVIPQLLLPKRQSLAFLAATGSGKTLAYCLPLLQVLKTQETFDGYERRPQRPRLLIVAPTRELVAQIHSVVKSLCHHIKLSSAALLGGEDTGKQRKRLSGCVDVVVATPGRLLKHWTAQNVFLGEITHVVVDEMDTMLEQGFEQELQKILYPVLYRKQPRQTISSDDYTETSPRLILTSATMTQTIQKMVGDTSPLVNAKKHYQSSTGLILPRLRVLQAPGLHKAVPRLKQTFINVGADDKLSLLVDQIVQRRESGDTRDAVNGLTMVFCNTAACCRAVQFSLQEAGIASLACHGELNSAMRSDQLRRFRQSGVDPTSLEPSILVCTDLVARGLDVPQVNHVVMFDFPLNSLDYLHRSGRTARGTSFGKVTALVTKRDQVLATAIQTAVQRNEPLDGLSSRKSDYVPGGRLHATSTGNKATKQRNPSKAKTTTARAGSSATAKRAPLSSRRSNSSKGISNSSFKGKVRATGTASTDKRATRSR